MISTRKKLVYGMALVAASGLFANELVNATRSEPLFTPIERAAEAEDNSGPMAAVAPDAQAPQLDDPAAQMPDSQPAESTQPKPELGAVLASLEAALERLGSAPPGADGRRVDALVRQQRPKAAPQPESEAAPSSPLAPPPVGDAVARRREHGEPNSRLQRFLDQSPLSGVVCSADSGVAMFGGRIVRTGEYLLGDDGVVSTCTPQGVGVLVAGREVWIPMPAVRVRPAASSAGSAQSGAAAAPSGRANTPAPNSLNTTSGAVGKDAPKAVQATAPSAAAGGAETSAGSARTGGQQ